MRSHSIVRCCSPADEVKAANERATAERLAELALLAETEKRMAEEAKERSATAASKALLADYKLVEALNPFARSHHSDITNPSSVSSPTRRERIDEKKATADF